MSQLGPENLTFDERLVVHRVVHGLSESSALAGAFMMTSHTNTSTFLYISDSQGRVEGFVEELTSIKLLEKLFCPVNGGGGKEVLGPTRAFDQAKWHCHSERAEAKKPPSLLAYSPTFPVAPERWRAHTIRGAEYHETASNP